MILDAFNNTNATNVTVEEVATDEIECGVDGEWCTWEALNSEPFLALMMTGMVCVINFIMPILLLTRWRFTSSLELIHRGEDNLLYYHGWLTYWIGNMILYGPPAIVFPLCFLEINKIDYFFVWWMDFLMQGYWSIVYQGMMMLMFLLAAALV